MKYIIRPFEYDDLRNELVRIDDNGEETVIAVDYGEPEDNSFDRSYRGIIKELEVLAAENTNLKEKLQNSNLSNFEK